MLSGRDYVTPHDVKSLARDVLRHRLVVSYAYDIPVRKDSFMDNQVFKGWTVSGIVTYQKGLPFSVTDSTSGGIFGTAAGTAQFVCSSIASAYTTGRIEDRLNQYINPACFTTAPLIPAAGFASNPGATGFGMKAVRFRGVHDDVSELPDAEVVIDRLPQVLVLIGLPPLT